MASYQAIKDRLYQEILACIVDGIPLPNPRVYRTPWRRDAAMVAMVLDRTGETARILEWIRSLTDPFDRNNGGQEEPDNLGQSLYLASLVSDGNHPVIEAVMRQLPRFVDENGVLVGNTDYGPKPVYQMKWLKFGLQRLGLQDDYQIPRVYDPYSALFWMDFRSSHVSGPPVISGSIDYPYLQWAEAHFHGWAPPMELLAEGEWLTWEANASEADYGGGERVCRPHSWHAAEAWLLLDDLEKQAG